MASFKETIELPAGWWWSQDDWCLIQARNHDCSIWVTSLTVKAPGDGTHYTQKADINWKAGSAKITADIIEQLKQAGTIAAAMNAYFNTK